VDRFTVDVTDSDGTRVLTMAGELDIAAAETVRRAIDERLEDARSVRVDCTDVTFIDSIGVKALLHLLLSSHERGAIVEFSFSTPVARVLNALGIADRFPRAAAHTAA